MSSVEKSRGLAPLGIVTVTFNSAMVLDDFLTSLSRQSFPHFLVYAIDNASSDATLTKLRNWNDPRLRIIANDVNVGMAEGSNQGARAAIADGCDYVLYLNNDIKFEPETFSVLLSEIKTLGCDMLGPKIWYGDGIRIWSAGGGFQPIKGYLGFHAGEGEIDRGQFEVPRLIQHSPGCCLLVPVGVFEKIGMLDPKYFVYCDDADFSFRAWRAGLTMFYTPRAQIIHKVSSLTGGSQSSFTIRYNVRGHVYFMLKNLGLMRCLYYLPAWEVRLIFKWLSRSISFSEFRLRQRAFFEGIAVWAS